jgi:methyl-accepting chemotaxis protein
VEDPTRPTRPIGQPPPRTVAARRETIVEPGDDLLVEEVQRLRFWTYFGAAVAVAASILGLIALIIAINNSSDGDSSRGVTRAQLDGLRQDLNGVRSDLAEVRSSANDAADDAQRLSTRVRRLEQSADDSANLADEISSLGQDIKELSDRVDQIELGGP